MERNARFWMWYGLPIVLATVISACGDADAPTLPYVTPPAVTEPPTDTTPPPDTTLPPGTTPTDTWPDCGPGLAAAPLAPPCRNPDAPTMGALEAVPNL